MGGLARRTAKESCRVMDNWGVGSRNVGSWAVECGELGRRMWGVDLMDRGKDKVEKV